MGPASQYNCLSERFARATEKVLQDVINFFGKQSVYLLLLSGDTRHFDHPNFSNDTSVPEEIAKRYCKLIDHINSSTVSQLIVATSVPSGFVTEKQNKWACSYWVFIRIYLMKTDILVLSNSSIKNENGSLLLNLPLITSTSTAKVR